MTLAERKKLYIKASKAYYNKQQDLILTDAEFDALERTIQAEEPEWEQLGKTGVRTNDRRREVRLNQFMPSLEKAYPDTLAKFVKRISLNALLVMDKLDGTSLQLRYVDGKPTQLTTRGDGEFGRDVSYFIPALVHHGRIPATLKDKDVFDLRLEGVMKKTVFEKKWSRAVLGEKKGAENARQLVNGVFLRNEPGPELADIDLKVLGVYGMTMENGLQLAEVFEFDCVHWEQPDYKDDPKFFFDLLAKRKEKSLYEIDGLVATHDHFVLHYESADKPKEIFAVKFNDEEEAFEVRVTDIEYAKTRLGRISIVACITPTRMDGVVVERVTVHNAAWMKERKIGPGAKIKVLRSGGVIPKIVGVVEPGRIKEPPFPYKQEGRYYVVDGDRDDRDVTVRAIRFFFTTLGIELLAEKTIEKMYDEGYTSINDYIELSHTDRVEDFMDAGLGEKQAANALNELMRVLNAPIPLKKLMVASGCFDAGVGERKLSSLEDAGISMRDLCNMKRSQIEERLIEVKGWSDKTIALMTDGVPRFREWYRPLKNVLKVDGNLPEKRKYDGGKLTGKKFAWTGYRSEQQEQKILANGGWIVTFGGGIDVLFYSKDGRKSTKVEKAGDKAMLWEDFVVQYGIE
jgi:NAD-dependent DNA ligase